jgi:pheromone shutdown-related protein TraB
LQNGVLRMSQTSKVLELGGRKITLLGTAHISSESVAEVSAAVREQKADCVAIELDEQRFASLNNPDSWRNLDIITVLRKKQGFLLLANLVLSGFQRRMGQNVGVRPGDEMRAAATAAESLGIPSVMVDRPIQVTLRRAWACNSLWGKCKLLATLLTSAFDREEISKEQIEDLKNRSEMDSMMHELAEYLPKVKEVLIDERDRYLACHIWECTGNSVLAVLGAGHLPGVERHLELLAAGKEGTSTADISSVPAKKLSTKILGWVIPVLIVLLIAAGFYFGGRQKGTMMIGTWFLWNGCLAALGTILAGGHPLAVIVGFVGAPFTSLCPVIGVGMFTGIVQAVFRKPKVADMETLQDDVQSVRGFYRNRLLRVLLVFFLSSLGSSIGTIVAGASFIGMIGSFFSSIAAHVGL